MSKTTFTVVRHGETEWNVTLQLQGQKDSALTAKGRKQIAATAEILKNREFDYLISSDSNRAIRTAEVINSYQNHTILTNAGLRERNFGIMEGYTRNQVKQRFPETYEGYINRIPDYKIPEGESLIEFKNRVVNTFIALSDNYTDKRLLIVTHGGVLDCVIRHIFNLPLEVPRKYRLYNASVNTFVIQDKNWILEEWGIISNDFNLKPKDELATLEIK